VNCEHEVTITVDAESFSAEYGDCGSHRLRVSLRVDPFVGLALLKEQVAAIEAELERNEGKGCEHRLTPWEEEKLEMIRSAPDTVKINAIGPITY